MDGRLTSDYEFDLPPHLIAQEPLPERTASRLMVVRRENGEIEHRIFADLVDLIPADDLLVINSTRVMRARLLGTRLSGAPAEILLLKQVGELWEAMVSPGGKLKPGRRVKVGDDLDVEIVDTTERRTRLVRLHSSLPDAQAIERHGHIPLPPYIARPDTPQDAGRYQTVYARSGRSVAAPTAGLHFSEELLAALERNGVRRAEVVLDVGAGTFKPVEAEDPAAHVMHEESFEIPEVTSQAIADARRQQSRVWAVGTTTVRTLESAVRPDGDVPAMSAETTLFIRPPHRFRVVDRMITNFHLPRSSLLMLVAAFAGYDLTMRAYREAIARGYRFFSYGDAMVIV
ncbi:MAG TPA: tRNA preQ1(34) S-adenosylmethionine ribosyltransferase-isomerase QueA [Gemmatimonadaceae bacterium]|nr:tRNA preQ1(34) S-adenosylmethionine ribosyltransferase-isomerase QueA [Gemmatimonadaceae bacterium]